VLGQVQLDGTSRKTAVAQPIITRLLEEPAADGVRIGVTTDLPLPRSTGMRRAGVVYGAKVGPTALAQVIGVSPGFLDTLGVPLIAGTGLSAAPDAHSAAAVIDETLARALWPSGSAVGRGLWLAGADDPLTVSGVVRAPAASAGLEDLRRFVFVPIDTVVPLEAFDVLLRGPSPDAALLAGLRQAVKSADPDVALLDPQPLRDYADPYAKVARAALGPALLAAGLAIFMAVAGLFAVVNHNVVSRLHEFGVRRALGASTAGLYAMIVKESLAVVARGTAIGAGASVFVALLLPKSMLFALHMADLVAVACIPAAAFGVAVLAMLPAAYRATTSDPLACLRV
jgi:hypothetical protein